VTTFLSAILSARVHLQRQNTNVQAMQQKPAHTSADLNSDSNSKSEESSCHLRTEVRDDIDFRSSNNTVIFIHGNGLPCRRNRLLLFKIMQSNSYRYSENILL